MTEPARPAWTPPCGLGLDAGGTQTRWAVVDAAGELRCEGQAAPLSGLQLDSPVGLAHIEATLAAIAHAAGPIAAIVAGVTGLDESQQSKLASIAATAFKLPNAAVQTMSDIELACRAAFAPGAGYVVYAGTGSIAAFIDDEGQLHRAGGRGVLIDDAGGGHWIARQALRQIWRAEDESPGAWRASPLAREVFAQIGGSDWAQTRQWAYGASRGELGALALAVAAAAPDDPAALALLRAAGTELARLAQAMLRRFGLRPVALAGRVFELHPAIEQAMRRALAADCELRHLDVPAHQAAARLASARIER